MPTGQPNQGWARVGLSHWKNLRSSLVQTAASVKADPLKNANRKKASDVRNNTCLSLCLGFVLYLFCLTQLFAVGPFSKWQMGKMMLTWLVMIECVFAFCLTLNEYMTLWPTVRSVSGKTNLTSNPCVHCIPMFKADHTVRLCTSCFVKL